MQGRLCALIVVALISGRAMGQNFPWWSNYGSVIEEVQDRGTLKVGLGLFEPWSICSADGGLIGFEIDVATKVAEDMDVEVEFVPTNWNYIIPALIAEEFDVIISGMTILPHRNLKINFTSPYNNTAIFLVANQTRAVYNNLGSLDDFNSPNVTIATRRGASSIPAIENVFPDAVIELFDTDTAVLDAVVSGDVHAAAAFATTGASWVEAHPDSLYLVSDDPFFSEVLAMGVRKGDVDALNFLSGWISIREADGWLPQHRQHWFETRDWEDQVATDPGTIAECEAPFQ
jgi:polar amino acid transport system substrate-binding protein